MNRPDRLRDYATARHGFTGDPTIEWNFHNDCNVAARAIEKMERIRRLIEDAEDPQVALNAIEDVIAAE